MYSKARKYFYLGPARNHLGESKRMLVRTVKVITTRKITWALVLISFPPTATSMLPVEGKGCEHGRSREASSIGSGTESGGDESASSSEGVRLVTSEADYTVRENTSILLGRAASATSSTGSSVHSAVSFQLKGRGPSGEGLADAPATSDSI